MFSIVVGTEALLFCNLFEGTLKKIRTIFDAVVRSFTRIAPSSIWAFKKLRFSFILPFFMLNFSGNASTANTTSINSINEEFWKCVGRKEGINGWINLESTLNQNVLLLLPYSYSYYCYYYCTLLFLSFCSVSVTILVTVTAILCLILFSALSCGLGAVTEPFHGWGNRHKEVKPCIYIRE